MYPMMHLFILYKKLARKVFASVRPVVTCVDKGLRGLTSNFHVLVLK